MATPRFIYVPVEPVHGLSGPRLASPGLVNLVRYPRAGSSSYAASNNFSGWPPSNAANGVRSGDEGWASTGWFAGLYWQCSFTVPQLLSRITTISRANTGSDFGIARAEFSDGSTADLGDTDIGNVERTTLFQPRLVTWFRVVAVSGGTGLAGFTEIEAF